MQVLEAAVKKAGSFDAEKIRDALQNLETKTIFGPYKVDAKGSQEAKQAYVFQVQKGVRKVIWPDDVKEADSALPDAAVGQAALNLDPESRPSCAPTADARGACRTTIPPHSFSQCGCASPRCAPRPTPRV